MRLNEFILPDNYHRDSPIWLFFENIEKRFSKLGLSYFGHILYEFEIEIGGGMILITNHDFRHYMD